MSWPTYTKAQEGQITKRALQRILEMGIYLSHHTTTSRPESILAYQLAEIDALRRLDDLPDDVRALHIRDLDEMYPETPTPVQAAIKTFTAVSAEAAKRHEEEVARFNATR